MADEIDALVSEAYRRGYEDRAKEQDYDPGHALDLCRATPSPSYHDLHITTASIPRTSIFDLPYGHEVVCTRVGGWRVWHYGVPVAGEYDGDGLRLDVAGHVIVDTLGRQPVAESKDEE